MKSPEEYRNAILDAMKQAYRLIRQYERQLQSKPLTRVYKNQHCKSAEKQQDIIAGIKADIEGEEDALIQAWKSLPEIENKTVIDVLEAKAFAAKLCKPKRNPRYLKNQKTFD